MNLMKRSEPAFDEKFAKNSPRRRSRSAHGRLREPVRGIVALVYRCHPQGQPVGSTPEAVDVRWQPLATIDDLMEPVYAIRVHHALAHARAYTRDHDGRRLVQSHVSP